MKDIILHIYITIAWGWVWKKNENDWKTLSLVSRRSKLTVLCFILSCMYYLSMSETLIKFSYLILSYLRVLLHLHLGTVAIADPSSISWMPIFTGKIEKVYTILQYEGLMSDVYTYEKRVNLILVVYRSIHNGWCYNMEKGMIQVDSFPFLGVNIRGYNDMGKDEIGWIPSFLQQICTY